MNCESRDRTTIECNLALSSCGIRTAYVRFSPIASKFKLFRHKAKWHKPLECARKRCVCARSAHVFRMTVPAYGHFSHTAMHSSVWNEFEIISVWAHHIIALSYRMSEVWHVHILEWASRRTLATHPTRIQHGFFMEASTWETLDTHTHKLH